MPFPLDSGGACVLPAIFLLQGLALSGKDTAMTTRDEAVEQLKIIRTMMERATIFRALSGETALIGGAAALAAAWLSDGKAGWAWANCWLAGLVLVVVFNAFQIFRASRFHKRAFWSMGLRTALRGAFPSIVAGGFLGLLFVRSGDVTNAYAAASIWILHYGIALLAIREFAPRSMAWLGWIFVVFGLYSLAEITRVNQLPCYLITRVTPSQLMAIAFGGFHLIYGAIIVTTKERDPDPA